MLAQDIKFGSYVAVDGYNGIAFWVDDWAKEIRDEFICLDEDGDVEWGWETVEIVSDTIVECYMVGDDRMFKFDIDDLTPLDIDNFCGSCGQIGCGHG